jgi:Ca2+-binding EF-hand superfamily protein
MKTIFLATSLFAAAAVWTASAEDLPVRSTEDVEVVFKALDRNSDRKISRSEASVKGSVSKRFDGIDSDGDGYLSKQEFAARPSAEPFE